MPQQANRPPSPIPLQNSSFGRLQAFPKPISRYTRDAGILAVRTVDFLVRSVTGIREFSQRSDCILRVSISYCQSEMILPDATIIEEGDRILELHFWNEHLIHCLHCQGPNELFGWGLCLERRGRLSLMLLAEQVCLDDDLADFEAIHASMTISLDRAERMFQHLGFIINYPRRSVAEQIHDFLESFLIGALVWAFHPYGLRKGKRAPRRVELWISKDEFLRLYGKPLSRMD